MLRVGCVDYAEDLSGEGKPRGIMFAQAQILQKAANESGYSENPNVHVQVEYACHAQYDSPPATTYAYIPIIRA